jgi:FkbM family methyltransferase
MIKNVVSVIRNLGIDVGVILDLGSRDLEQSIEFTREFPSAKVHAFECNSKSAENCKTKLIHFPNIRLYETCVFDYDGMIKFHPINTEKTITTWKDGNPGASSVFVANGSYDHIEKYVQDEVNVRCTRLDTWANENFVPKVDVVWADLQGAELQAFIGMGSLLNTVKVIHTELEINPMYSGQSLFKDVDPYLRKMGFTRVSGDTRAQYGADFIYVNTSLEIK